MPIDRKAIEAVAKAHKIIRLRKIEGMDELAVRVSANPNSGEMLHAATWAAAFELASSGDDAWTIADKLERMYKQRNVPGVQL